MRQPRKTFLKRGNFRVDFALQLTSLVDVFLLLLLFLLRGWTGGLAGSAPATAARLPAVESGVGETFPDLLRVEFAKTGLLVDGTAIATLHNFAIEPKAWDALRKKLSVSRQRDRKAASEIRAALYADEAAPADTVQRLALVLAENGFRELKLVVVDGK